eukprot:TRINITY_DN4199_c0_g4_i5.p1 TRINITY_DN4199_c0_g4~~TRINITY_DN4199_c0_g4_i5.p1  ORF type:complete len:384 (-),score=54.61 TRINITY_DN4199_c0_g4_i5:239-1390(-)
MFLVRYLPKVSQQFVLRTLFQVKLINQVYNIWIKEPEIDIDGEKRSVESIISQLLELRIFLRDVPQSQTENKQMVYFSVNPSFKHQLMNFITNGYNPRFKEEGLPLGESQIIMIKDQALRKWREIHNMMLKSDTSIKGYKRIIEVLLEARLVRRYSNYIEKTSITSEGFKFILDTIDNQINIFIHYYTFTLLKPGSSAIKMDGGDPFLRVVEFIFALNLLPPNQLYSLSGLNPWENEILEDFYKYGLVYKPDDQSRAFSVTPLLSHFIYDKYKLNVDLDLEILVETNFKIFAYTTLDSNVELLEIFSKIKYRFANILIGELKKRTCKSAFQNGITAKQIIEFLNKNAHRKKKSRVEEKSKDFPFTQRNLSCCLMQNDQKLNNE